MKLTKKGRYAVMAMADLASNQSLKPVSLTDISLRQNISLSYLEHLFSRLKNKKLYKKWYGLDHRSSELINKSIYSITEFVRDELKNYNIISCPGCYPTSIQIPLVPLIKENMIDVNNIIIVSKSGYSGAGKNVKKKILI